MPTLRRPMPALRRAETRDDVIRTADRLRRAAQLLECHARRCTDEDAHAHAAALRQARGMVRAVVSDE